MQLSNETLRQRRIHLLLRNAPNFCYISLVFAILFGSIKLSLGSTLSQIIPSLIVMLLSGFSLGYLHYCHKKLKQMPLWDPLLLLSILCGIHGCAWGIIGGQNDIGLSLAIVMTAVTGIYLFSYSRLLIITMGSITLTTIPLLFINDNPLLYKIYLPFITVIMIASYKGYHLSIGYLRNEMESERLTRLLTENQVTLKGQIQKRTKEIEETNRQLSLEVELRKEVNQALIKSEEQLNLAMTASGIGFWDWDIANQRVYHSDMQHFFNTQTPLPSEFDLASYVLKEDRRSIRNALANHLKGKTEYYQARYRVVLPNSDKIYWLEDIGRISERDTQQKASRMIGTRRDVSKDMRLQEELSLSSSLFNISSEGVFVLDEKQQFRTGNQVFCQIFNRQKGELIGKSLFQIIPTEQAHTIDQSLTSNGRWSGEIITVRGDNDRFPISLTLTIIRRKDKSVSHFLGICQDLSESLQTQKELKYLHNYDKLTGLFNRSYFHNVLGQFHDHSPLQEQHYAVCVLNLDRFKSINESLDINVGDQLLKFLAARLSNYGEPIQQIARLSSDEFALIIEYEGNQDLLLHTLEQLKSEITRPFLIDDHELIVTASMGLCIVQPNNLNQLLNHAIAAMNQARYQGGNNYQFYHRKLVTTPLERLQLEKALRRSVANNEFSVDYQPKMNLHTGIIDSVEALVRWLHPHKGIIDPEEFIPLAEETGLISAIGEQVLNKACMEAATWHERGFGDISISVNLSSHQIRRDDLYDVVNNALTNSQLPAKYLELELTESMLMEDINHAQEFLGQLRSLGVRLALDDFGTGYSSFNYLKRLPIDTLKIDRSFVSESRNGQRSPLVEAILRMADSLKIAIVAEGVETKEQLNYLEKMGCDYAQGYIISRPLPASEVLTLIRHSNLRTIEQSTDSIH